MYLLKDLEVPKIIASINNGVLGVDINDKVLAVTVTNPMKAI